MAILVPIPLGPSVVARNLDLGVFYVLAVSSISTIGILMADAGGRALAPNPRARATSKNPRKQGGKTRRAESGDSRPGALTSVSVCS